MVHDSSKPQFSKAVWTERSPYVSPSSSTWRSFISRFYLSLFLPFFFLFIQISPFIQLPPFFIPDLISWRITRIIDFIGNSSSPNSFLISKLSPSSIYLHGGWKFDLAIYIEFSRKEKIRKTSGSEQVSFYFENKYGGRFFFQPSSTRLLPFFFFPRLISADVEGRGSQEPRVYMFDFVRHRVS